MNMRATQSRRISLNAMHYNVLACFLHIPKTIPVYHVIMVMVGRQL